MPNKKAQMSDKRNVAKKCKPKAAAKPDEVKPDEVKPPETKPPEAKPAEAKPPEEAVNCDPITKPPELPKPEEKVDCVRPDFNRTAQEKREFLEQEVVPIMMEGMMALARDMPNDPINYLEKFWLKERHKCDIPLPNDLL